MFYILLMVACAIALVAALVIGRGMEKAVGAIIALVVALVLTGLFSWTTVDSGTIKTTTIFGEVQEGFLEHGQHFINPIASTTTISIRRESYDYVSEGGDGSDTVALSADEVPLRLNVGFPVSLNPEMAWKIQTRYGAQIYGDELVLKASWTAVRDAVAAFEWRKAVNSDRAALKARMLEEFRNILVRDMVAQGFTEAEAKRAFSISEPQIRIIQPPKRIMDENAEKEAAEIAFDRQAILTKIANEEAKRRANEGLGVAKMFAELPEGYSTSEMAQIINALADKQRADAFLKAIEMGNVDIIVTDGGGSNTPIAVNPKQ